jgi:hypothetical protein
MGNIDHRVNQGSGNLTVNIKDKAQVSNFEEKTGIKLYDGEGNVNPGGFDIFGQFSRLAKWITGDFDPCVLEDSVDHPEQVDTPIRIITPTPGIETAPTPGIETAPNVIEKSIAAVIEPQTKVLQILKPMATKMVFAPKVPDPDDQIFNAKAFYKH